VRLRNSLKSEDVSGFDVMLGLSEKAPKLDVVWEENLLVVHNGIYI
jgi:hypothetical protein